MSSAVHWFGRVEYSIFVLIFSSAVNNKSSTFKVRHVQIDMLQRTLVTNHGLVWKLWGNIRPILYLVRSEVLFFLPFLKVQAQIGNVYFLSARIASASASKDLNCHPSFLPSFLPCALSQNLDIHQFLSSIKFIWLCSRNYFLLPEQWGQIIFRLRNNLLWQIVWSNINHALWLKIKDLFNISFKP